MPPRELLEVNVFSIDERNDSLNSLFHLIRLRRKSRRTADDKNRKVEQIKSYLAVMDADIRRMTRKRPIVVVESAAGNCYLSLLAYNHYVIAGRRSVEIHCIDTNSPVLEHAKKTARDLGYNEMHFHSCDILDFDAVKKADIACSLHACDSATDKALYLGMKMQASHIFSVACCQHEIARRFQNRGLKGVTKYKAFRERLSYMIEDSMRAHLLAMNGYKVDVFDFTSSRYTERNTMLRARRNGQQDERELRDEYESLKARFQIEPQLSRLIENRGLYI